MPIPNRDDDVIVAGGDDFQIAKNVEVRGSVFTTMYSLIPRWIACSTQKGGMLRAFSWNMWPPPS